MKKTLFTILTLLLSVLFLITACDSPAGVLPQETTVGGTPAGSDIVPDETTADIENTSEELESTSEEVTTLPEYFETFPEEQKEQLLQIMQKHPDVVAFSNQYPSVFDADFSNCVSSDVFYALLEELNGASIKFEDLIEIVGKPHYRTVLSTGNVSLISTTSVFTWVSSDGKLFSATIQNRLEYPEEASLEEILLYYCEIVLHGSEASTNTQSLNTTAPPETTTAAP